jgi:hypothetical protein
MKKPEKKKKVKKEEQGGGTTVALPGPPPKGNYGDGAEFDKIKYLEAKLILKPDRFTSVDGFREFGQAMQATAKKVGVGFIADPNTSRRPEIREIIFVDTPDFRLYNNSFILRRRISYVDGFPVGDPEIVFKFRSEDRDAAIALDVRPKIAGKYRIKLKAQAMPLKDQVGGMRILFSHNCQFGISQAHDADKTSMSTLLHVFPALAALKTVPNEKVSLVNGGIVEEVLLPLGQLDFKRGIIAKCDVSLWRSRGDHMPLIGEFGFQVRFEDAEEVGMKSRNLARQFFIALQHDVQHWMALGTTKTGTVYRMKGYKPESDE